MFNAPLPLRLRSSVDLLHAYTFEDSHSFMNMCEGCIVIGRCTLVFLSRKSPLLPTKVGPTPPQQPLPVKPTRSAPGPLHFTPAYSCTSIPPRYNPEPANLPRRCIIRFPISASCDNKAISRGIAQHLECTHLDHKHLVYCLIPLSFCMDFYALHNRIDAVKKNCPRLTSIGCGAQQHVGITVGAAQRK